MLNCRKVIKRCSSIDKYHHIPPLPITSRHLPSLPITSRHFPSLSTTSRHFLSHPVTSHHLPSLPITSCHLPSLPATSRHIVSHIKACPMRAGLTKEPEAAESTPNHTELMSVHEHLAGRSKSFSHRGSLRLITWMVLFYLWTIWIVASHNTRWIRFVFVQFDK